MEMFTSKAKVAFCVLSTVICLSGSSIFAMGGKPQEPPPPPQTASPASPPDTSSITLKELAQVYWPDSNSTEVQKEETLKKILGKLCTFEVTVAQVQRKDGLYMVQGQSDENQLGTFSYIEPKNQEEIDQLVNASRGSTLSISGIAAGMEMRHLVLMPAYLNNPAK